MQTALAGQSSGNSLLPVITTGSSRELSNIPHPEKTPSQSLPAATAMRHPSLSLSAPFSRPVLGLVRESDRRKRITPKSLKSYHSHETWDNRYEKIVQERSGNVSNRQSVVLEQLSDRIEVVWLRFTNIHLHVLIDSGNQE
ncbi:hypothetical protein [Paraburkholderia bannensis]|uniref:hypothetical protein n=1 Tax=Paraburkholderia bannensis TaxID=765414 RepID=UPI0012EBEAF0|nr:hypothetical protein [Paraburkholderia bannensis]